MADLERKYNLKSPAVKRLMREAAELKEPHQHYHAQPLEDNLFEWHFTVRGPADSDFDGGRYHGRIVLPPEYPMKPPSIILITPNGRFELGKKICLSMSAHHPETWQPSWSIRTVLLALIGFMPTKGGGAIGALDYSSQERKVLAMRSLEWKCDACGVESSSALADTRASSEEGADGDEAKELASQISFKGEAEKPVASQDSTDSSVSATTPLPQQLQTSLPDPPLSLPPGFQPHTNFSQAYQQFASCMYQSPMFRHAPPNQVQFPYNFLNQYGMYNQQYPGSIPTAGIVTPPQNFGYNRASSLSSVSSSTANGSIASEVERKTSVCEPGEEAPVLPPTNAATASATADSVSSGPLLSNADAATESCMSPLTPDGLRHRTGQLSSADRVAGAASTTLGPVPVRPARASGPNRRSTFDFATVVLMWIVAVLLIILVLRRLALEKSSML